MTPEMITSLARRLAAEIDVTAAEAEEALASQDPAMIGLAEALLKLGDTREGWHDDMRRHRKRILAAA